MGLTKKHMDYFRKFNIYQSGFTLVELLVVIAIIGVLAAVVLLSLNPLEQLARGRDTGRVSSVAQLGRAMQAYYTSQSALPTTPATWQTVLQTAGEIKVASTVPATGVTACPTNNMSGVCYVQNGTSDFFIWTPVESKSSKLKAGGGTTACATYAAAIYDSSLGKGGVGCLPAGGAMTASVALY